jgi:hypothetical protein
MLRLKGTVAAHSESRNTFALHLLPLAPKLSPVFQDGILHKRCNRQELRLLYWTNMKSEVDFWFSAYYCVLNRGLGLTHLF